MRLVLLALLASCVSPSRARYLGGGYASLEDSAEIDNACRRRVAQTAIEPREATQRVRLEPARAIAVAPPVEAPPAQVSTGGELTVDAGPLGRLRVVVRAPLAATVPLAQLETPPPQPVRGFLFGVDLRPYKRIAFVIDSGGAMCNVEPGVAMPIDRATDQLIAAISGLPTETSFVLLGTASGVRELVPAPGDNGRRAAMQWSCNLFCSGDTSLAMALLDAFAEQPEVVVVMSTDGASYLSGQQVRGAERDLQLFATDPERVLERTVSGARSAPEGERGSLDRVAGAVPIIAIDLGRGSPHLAAIAEKTGGIVVRP